MRYGLTPAALRRTVDPSTLPVTLEEFKLHARIDIDDDDDFCTSALTAATDQCEVETERALVTQTWRALYPDWAVCLVLPRPPLASVTSVEYQDTAGDWQTVASSNYYVHTDAEPGIIQFKDTYSFQSLSDSAFAVRVVFVTGYGAASDVPENAKRAICILAAHYYENRQVVALGQTPLPIQRTFRSLVNSIRVPSLQ